MSIEIVKHPTIRNAYRLTTKQRLRTSRNEVFDVFADAFQLEGITPPWLKFAVLTPSPIEMRVGAIIDYKLRLHGVPIRWQTGITAWEPPYRFVDEQRRGPYALWRHEHRFAVIDGGTSITDQVDYKLPGGSLIHSLFVKSDLFRIFHFRQTALAKLFRQEPQPVGIS